MRFLFRLGVLALAVVGAKALYDRSHPRPPSSRGPAGDVLGSAKSAARDVTQHAKDAAAEVADDARQRADDVTDQASAAADQAQDIVSDDAPTVATPDGVSPRLTAAANRAGRLDHRVVPDAVEQFDDGVGPRLAQTVRHRHHRDRDRRRPTPRAAATGALDGTGVARLVAPSLLDVADEPRQQPVAVGARDQLPLRDQLVVGHRRRRTERRGQPALHRRGVERRLRPASLVGQREEQLLARD